MEFEQRMHEIFGTETPLVENVGINLTAFLPFNRLASARNSDISVF